MTKAIFLGTAGYHPSETRHTACVFVPEYGLVLDAGTGLFRLIGRIRTEHLRICISHAHLDHVAGLTYFIDVLHRHPEVSDIRIYGGQEHLVAVKSKFFSPLIFPVLPKWQEAIIAEKEFLIGDINVKTMPLRHNGGAVGYRFEFPDGKILAYITDTEVNDDYLPLLYDADLAIHECNFPDSMAELAAKTTHSTTSAVLRLAKQGRVKQLALFHFNPLDDSEDPAHLDEAEETFPGVIVARDLMEVEF